MCLYPKLIQNKKYTVTKKNGGNVPAIFDKRVLAVPVGCGVCIECKKKKARDWSVRLHEEIRNNKTKGYFMTMTFSDESLKELGKITKKTGYEKDNEIATIAVRRFLERWRKEHKKSVRHWLVTEIGKTNSERIHIHGVIWTEKEKEEIGKHWKYGWVDYGKYVNEKTINYIVKYIYKTDEVHKHFKGKVLCSQGIGRGYIERIDSKKNKYKRNETNEKYQTRNGQKMDLPIYYRNAIYSDEEKEKLWLEKLDKDERWVMGEKANGWEDYIKARNEARKISKKLGYIPPGAYNEKKYEEERREMIYAKIIENDPNNF